MGVEINRRHLMGALGGLAVPALAGSSAQALDPGMFVNPFEERIIGVKNHPAQVKRLGGFYGDAALSNYLIDLGMRAAKAVARYPDQFVFSVVNNAECNACASYGGFIYVNTGLLPWMNDEADFLSIIGHEVGHSINRHMARSHSRKSVADRLIIMRSLRDPQSYEANQARALLMHRAYDRDQETQSDDVGLKVLSSLQYDPFAMATGLNQFVMLERHYAKLGAAGNTPLELRSHPPSADRVRRQWAAAEAAGFRPGEGRRNRDQYLAMIDGVRLPADKLFGGGPTRIRVVTVQPSDTVASLGARMVAAPRKTDLFMAINGLTDPSKLTVGSRVKLITT